MESGTMSKKVTPGADGAPVASDGGAPVGRVARRRGLPLDRSDWPATLEPLDPADWRAARNDEPRGAPQFTEVRGDLVWDIALAMLAGGQANSFREAWTLALRDLVLLGFQEETSTVLYGVEKEGPIGWALQADVSPPDGGDEWDPRTSLLQVELNVRKVDATRPFRTDGR